MICSSILFGTTINFNPRTREGCDGDDIWTLHVDFNISIHAPVKGATMLVNGTNLSVKYFNPRTREGCDATEDIARKRDIKFQSTHP